MWPFGPSVDEMVKNRDIAGLWNRLSKKFQQWDVFLQFADEAWDYVSVRAVKERKDWPNDLHFASFLCRSDKHYAGTKPVTPAEFLGRMGKAMFGDKPPKEGTCPSCAQFLSDSPVQGEVGMYSKCVSCGRLYHRNCFAQLSSCRECGGTKWEMAVRR